MTDEEGLEVECEGCMLLVSSDEWGSRGDDVRLPSDCRVNSSASIDAASGAIDVGIASTGSGGMDDSETKGSGGAKAEEELKGGDGGREREAGMGERVTVPMDGEREWECSNSDSG